MPAARPLVAVAAVVAAIVLIVAVAGIGGEEVLVVPIAPPIEVEEGETALVRGTLERFSFDPSYGDADDFERFEGETVIVADSIVPITAEEIEPEDQSGIVSLEEVAGDGAARFDEPVSVVGTAGERIGTEAFVLHQAD